MAPQYHNEPSQRDLMLHYCVKQKVISFVLQEGRHSKKYECYFSNHHNVIACSTWLVFDLTDDLIYCAKFVTTLYLCTLEQLNPVGPWGVEHTDHQVS